MPDATPTANVSPSSFPYNLAMLSQMALFLKTAKYSIPTRSHASPMVIGGKRK
jgi:hypothetical protein